MKGLLGLIISCVLVPAVYAGLVYGYVAYFGRQPSKTDPLKLAVLIALPLVASGMPKWWDVWIVPSPKLGSPWKSYSPSEFVADIVKLNTIGIVAFIVVHLLVNQFIATEVATTNLTLDVPQARARLAQIEPELADANQRLEAARLKMNDSGPAGFHSDEERRVAGMDVNRLTDERRRILGQLEEHEQKAKLLEAAGKNPGDHLAPWALMTLFGSALYFSFHDPINKRFHSGQPIRQG